MQEGPVGGHLGGEAACWGGAGLGKGRMAAGQAGQRFVFALRRVAPAQGPRAPRTSALGLRTPERPGC